MTSRSIVERTDFPDYDAWCDDCVCIEETSRQAHSLPQQSKCRRAACSKIRPVLTRETNCLHDLRAFPCNQSLWSSARTLRFVQFSLAEWRRPRFQRSMGSSPSISERYALTCDAGRIVQVKNARLCSASVLALYDQKTVRNNGQTSYLRLKTPVKLHICHMMRTRNFRVRNEVVERGAVTNLRWEESGRVLSLEGTWTMFQRRPM